MDCQHYHYDTRDGEWCDIHDVCNYSICRDRTDVPKPAPNPKPQTQQNNPKPEPQPEATDQSQRPAYRSTFAVFMRPDPSGRFTTVVPFEVISYTIDPVKVLAHTLHNVLKVPVLTHPIGSLAPAEAFRIIPILPIQMWEETIGTIPVVERITVTEGNGPHPNDPHAKPDMSDEFVSVYRIGRQETETRRNYTARMYATADTPLIDGARLHPMFTPFEIDMKTGPCSGFRPEDDAQHTQDRKNAAQPAETAKGNKS